MLQLAVEENITPMSSEQNTNTYETEVVNNRARFVHKYRNNIRDAKGSGANNVLKTHEHNNNCCVTN